jgi:GNAT superfamily N-acetyltransferase
MRQRGLGLHLPSPNAGPWHRTIVAEQNGTIVGVGSAMGMPWHPGVLLTDVMVLESARRRGTGTALLARVRTEARSAGDQRLFGQIRPDWEGAGAFAKARGFTMVMRSRMWRFDPDEPSIRSWTDRVSHADHGYRIEAGVDPADPRVGKAIRDLYDWMHASWNPLGPVSAAQFSATFGPRIIAGSAVLAYRADAVAGVATLLRSPSMPSMRPFISMVGPTDPKLPRAAELTGHLAALCFERARALGQGLEAEADDAHVALAAELERLPSIATNELLQLVEPPTR